MDVLPFSDPPLRRLSVFFSVVCLAHKEERFAALGLVFLVFGLLLPLWMIRGTSNARLDLLDASFLPWAALRAKMVDMARS